MTSTDIAGRSQIRMEDTCSKVLTNLRPLSPGNIEFFPEREIQEVSKKRKRIANQENWLRIKNKRRRNM